MYTWTTPGDELLRDASEVVLEEKVAGRRNRRRFRRFPMTASISVRRQGGLLKRYQPLPCRLINISTSGMEVVVADASGRLRGEISKGERLDIQLKLAPDHIYRCTGLVQRSKGWVLGVEFEELPDECRQYLFLRSLEHRR